MKFVDQVKIEVRAGHGGAGHTSFRREKYVPRGGPDGGDGGKGGDVVLVAKQSLQTLMDLTLRRQYKAANGAPGGKKNQFGLNGEDLVIQVPCGTMVFNTHNELLADLKHSEDTVVIAKGGKGGKGNQHFATSINRAPQYSQSGLPGETLDLVLELRMLAEVGLIGLPNAGKSTLLKTLTQANPKIADYPFTTLFPNLGVLKFVDREIVLADIPGLIEGASEGAGLGSDFLRHVDRTRLLVHVVACEMEGPELTFKHFETVRNELLRSPYGFENKACIVVLNKVDIMTPEEAARFQRYFHERQVQCLSISAVNRSGIPQLIEAISEGLKT